MSAQWLFPGWHSGWWWWVTTAAVVVAVGLIVTLMRYERRLVPRSVGTSLLLLRLAVLAWCCSSSSCSRPMAWVVDKTKSGRVVVAVDLSESTGDE